MKHAVLALGFILSIGATSRADYGYWTSVETTGQVGAPAPYYAKLVWTSPSTAMTRMQVTISAPDGSVVTASEGGMKVGSDGTSSGYVSADNQFTPTQVGTYTPTFNGQDSNGINLYSRSVSITVTQPPSGGGGP